MATIDELLKLANEVRHNHRRTHFDEPDFFMIHPTTAEQFFSIISGYVYRDQDKIKLFGKPVYRSYDMKQDDIKAGKE